MADRENITPEYLRQIIDYDPETGEMTWLPRTAEMFGGCAPEQCADWFNKNMAGKIAGGVGPRGYRMLEISGKNFRAARVAWAIAHGRWPSDQIDHINCIRSDDRLSNLREATAHQNARNKSASVRNATGVKGVHFERSKNKFMAQVRANGEYVFRRRFKTLEEAAAAYAEAARQYHGEFARTA